MRRRLAFALGLGAFIMAALAPTVGAARLTVGAVYTETNATAGNSVLVWGRHLDGSLTYLSSVSAGGTGTGASLGDQGAVTVSSDLQWLYAVDAGSNQVSTFRIIGTSLSLVDVAASGGTMPVSVTSRNDVVYVLNAGGSGTIAGFRRDVLGRLHAIPGSVQALSQAGAGAAQVSFSQNGRSLVVTEKATSRIDVFPVGPLGVAGPATVVPSAGAVPFGFAITNNGTLIVSEAGPSAASSYRLTGGGVSLRTASLVDLGEAPCWFVATNNGRYAYTTNAHTNTISGYAVNGDGTIDLLNADGVTATTAGAPTDEALDLTGRFLYVRLGNGGIQSYVVRIDGALVALATTWGLPAGVVGLAAW